MNDARDVDRREVLQSTAVALATAVGAIRGSAAAEQSEGTGDVASTVFRHQVSPRRKLGGDNPDAIYWATNIDGRQAYRIRGNVDGAVCTSITVEAGGERGGYAEGLAGVIPFTNAEGGT